MKWLNLIILSIFFINCSINDSEQTIKKQNNTTNIEDGSNKYKSIKLKCEEKELPSTCVASNLKVSFLFNEEPNIIEITTDNGKYIYYLDKYFEGLDYKASLFEKQQSRILVIKFDYEYSSSFLILNIKEKGIYILRTIEQGDLEDNNGESLVNEILGIEYITSNKVKIYIGNQKNYNEYELEDNEQGKLKKLK